MNAEQIYSESDRRTLVRYLLLMFDQNLLGQPLTQEVERLCGLMSKDVCGDIAITHCILYVLMNGKTTLPGVEEVLMKFDMKLLDHAKGYDLNDKKTYAETMIGLVKSKELITEIREREEMLPHVYLLECPDLSERVITNFGSVYQAYLSKKNHSATLLKYMTVTSPHEHRPTTEMLFPISALTIYSKQVLIDFFMVDDPDNLTDILLLLASNLTSCQLVMVITRRLSSDYGVQVKFEYAEAK